MYKGEQPQVMVEGWNAWFYDDINNLPRVWPHFGKNKQSLGELWVGLLRFYTEVFDFRESVVCIRRSAVLSRFEKLWSSRNIKVEDPFELEHNLGAGLTSRMNVFIRKAFINGRSHFCTPVLMPPPGYSSLLDYMFDPKIMTHGPPPADRNCRKCGKIGHWRKECPQLLEKQRKSDAQHEISRERSDSSQENRRVLKEVIREQNKQVTTPKDKKPAQKQVTSSAASSVNRSKSVEGQGEQRKSTKSSRSETSAASGKHKVRLCNP